MISNYDAQSQKQVPITLSRDVHCCSHYTIRKGKQLILQRRENERRETLGKKKNCCHVIAEQYILGISLLC